MKLAVHVLGRYGMSSSGSLGIVVSYNNNNKSTSSSKDLLVSYFLSGIILFRESFFPGAFNSVNDCRPSLNLRQALKHLTSDWLDCTLIIYYTFILFRGRKNCLASYRCYWLVYDATLLTPTCCWCLSLQLYSFLANSWNLTDGSLQFID